MIELEIDGINASELAHLLDNMYTSWNSTRLMGKMWEPIFRTRYEDPVWVYFFYLSQTWREAYRLLILEVEAINHQSFRIRIFGVKIKSFYKTDTSENLENEVAEFLTNYLS